MYRTSTECKNKYSEDVTLSVYCVHAFLYRMLWPNARAKFSEHDRRIFYVHCAQSSLYAEHAGLKEGIINLLKPNVYVMHHQFNIQKLYALPTLYLCVLYLSENKQRLVPLTV